MQAPVKICLTGSLATWSSSESATSRRSSTATRRRPRRSCDAATTTGDRRPHALPAGAPAGAVRDRAPLGGGRDLDRPGAPGHRDHPEPDGAAGRAPRRGARHRRGRTALVACAEGELHSLGVRMVADFLDADGWDVLFVGALSPVEARGRAGGRARRRRGRAVGVAGERCPEVTPPCARCGRSIRAPLIAVGGQAFVGDRAARAGHRRRSVRRRRRDARARRWRCGSVVSASIETGSGARTRSSRRRCSADGTIGARTRRSSTSPGASWRACRSRR